MEDMLGEVNKIAEELRQEPYALFRNDCLRKSVRFVRRCRKLGIPARLVVCLGLARATRLPRKIILPVIHGWGEVEGCRIEVSRPLGSAGILGIVPIKIKPLIKLKF